MTNILKMKGTKTNKEFFEELYEAEVDKFVIVYTLKDKSDKSTFVKHCNLTNAELSFYGMVCNEFCKDKALGTI